jgi:nucleotide-binding universal stress UspA family protein
MSTPIRTAAPVVDPPATTRTGPVVVGVDGTDRSIRALRWAAAEAERRGAGLVAVHACEPAGHLAPYAPVRSRPHARDLAAALAARLAELIAAALGDQPAVPVRAVCRDEPAVRALLSEAAEASLLVLATVPDRGTGVTAGATAVACIRNAPCPVVVLPRL